MTKDAVNIGSRLEPFVDDWLIDSVKGVELRLHSPVARDRAIVFDRPWGGLGCYVTVFQDDDRYRMYYSAGPPCGPYLGYAESKDGKRWRQPELGLVRFEQRWLSEPLGKFTVESVEFDDEALTAATVTVRNGGERLRFPVGKEQGSWYLTLTPVTATGLGLAYLKAYESMGDAE